MKKFTILVASFLLAGSMAKASENPVFSENTKAIFGFDEPISFNERGIQFFVFPNGEFDFNTRPNDSQGDYHYKTAGRRSVAIQINRAPINYGIRIEHDAFGRVRRIGNTFVNYDFNNRVSRIGTIFMRYNRFALSQIGGLRIVYNHRGQIIRFLGSVKGQCNVYQYQNGPSYYRENANGWNQNQNDDDDDDDDDDDNENSDYYFKNNKNKEQKLNSESQKKED